MPGSHIGSFLNATHLAIPQLVSHTAQGSPQVPNQREGRYGHTWKWSNIATIL